MIKDAQVMINRFLHWHLLNFPKSGLNFSLFFLLFLMFVPFNLLYKDMFRQLLNTSLLMHEKMKTSTSKTCNFHVRLIWEMSNQKGKQ